MATASGDPARDPRPPENPWRNLDLPPEAFPVNGSVSAFVFRFCRANKTTILYACFEHPFLVGDLCLPCPLFPII